MHYVNFLMSHGLQPYSQITDNNLPGAYLIESWAMHVFGGGDLAWRIYDFFLLGVLTLSMRRHIPASACEQRSLVFGRAQPGNDGSADGRLCLHGVFGAAQKAGVDAGDGRYPRNTLLLVVLALALAVKDRGWDRNDRRWRWARRPVWLLTSCSTRASTIPNLLSLPKGICVCRCHGSCLGRGAPDLPDVKNAQARATHPARLFHGGERHRHAPRRSRLRLC